MYEDTLDRMVYAYESKIRELRGLDFPSKQDQRQAMLAALRAMFRPIDEAPVNTCCILMRVHDDGLPWFCMGLIEPDGTARMADYASVYLECDFEPTHFAPLLPGPEE